MKPWKPSLILTCIASLILASGCSIFSEKPLYLPAGSAVEVKKQQKVEVWITNASTGGKEARSLVVEPGYLIARPALKPLNEGKPQEQSCPIPTK